MSGAGFRERIPRLTRHAKGRATGSGPRCLSQASGVPNLFGRSRRGSQKTLQTGFGCRRPATPTEASRKRGRIPSRTPRPRPLSDRGRARRYETHKNPGRSVMLDPTAALLTKTEQRSALLRALPSSCENSPGRARLTPRLSAACGGRYSFDSSLFECLNLLYADILPWHFLLVQPRHPKPF